MKGIDKPKGIANPQIQPRYELKVADPAQDNKFTHITSSEIAKEHIMPNLSLEMIKFKPK